MKQKLWTILQSFRPRLGQHLQMVKYHMDLKISTLHQNFSLIDFQKTETLKIHNFLISNQNEMNFMSKCLYQRDEQDKIHFAYFFRTYFKFLQYFYITEFFQKFSLQTHIFNSTFKTTSPYVPPNGPLI